MEDNTMNGELCIYCGYLESHHSESAKQYYHKIKPGYEYAADDCPGFEGAN